MSDPIEIKDPAVAVQLARIDGKMEGMRASNDNQSKQLDSIVQDLREVTRASQRYEVQHQRLESLELSHLATKEKVNKMFYFSSGVTSVSAILLGLVLWVLSNEMTKSTRNNFRIDSIELHLAKDQIRPYTPRY